MHWKAILNNACKCSTFLMGPSSQWEGSYPLFMFGKDCLTTWIIFVVIKSGANLTTNPADWNNTLACIPCNSIQYHAISNITQYHTIQGNLAKHIGVLRTPFFVQLSFYDLLKQIYFDMMKLWIFYEKHLSKNNLTAWFHFMIC